METVALYYHTFPLNYPLHSDKVAIRGKDTSDVYALRDFMGNFVQDFSCNLGRYTSVMAEL
jgi:hypothetical protein